MSARAYPYVIGSLIGCSLGLVLLLVGLVLEIGPLAGILSGGDVEASPTSHFADMAMATPPSSNGLATRGDVIAGERRGAIVEATRLASPAVVSVTVLDHEFVRAYSSPLEMLLNRGRRGSQVRRQTFERRGSGVILDGEGHIVTNDHVIGDVNKYEIYVTLSDGRQFEVDLVGRAYEYDLALLKFKLPIEDHPVATLGDSDGLEIGEWAIAIGSPYGYLLEDPAPSVTVGVISATHRDFQPPEDDSRAYMDMLQTDAAINEGNSGGALVNASGEVVGINTFIISGRGGGGSIGLGFAVPINRVRWVLDEILEHGGMRPRYAGIDFFMVNPRLRSYLNLEESVTGMFLRRVIHNSPADDAGLQAGDIIRGVAGEAIHQYSDWIRLVYEARVGTELEMLIQRGGEMFEASMTLSEVPQTAQGQN